MYNIQYYIVYLVIGNYFNLSISEEYEGDPQAKCLQILEIPGVEWLHLVLDHELRGKSKTNTKRLLQLFTSLAGRRKS